MNNDNFPKLLFTMALHVQNAFISRFYLRNFDGKFITAIKQFYRKSLAEKREIITSPSCIKFYKSFLFLVVLKSINPPYYS